MKRNRICFCIIVILIIIVAAIFILPKDTKPESRYYAKEATITSIDIVHERIGATDKYQEWFWYYGDNPENYPLGEEVLLVMKDNGTDWIYDDEVISVTHKD